MSKAKPMLLKILWLNQKNISNDPRPQDSGDVYINGLKVRAISGADSSRLKFKVKNKNNN